MSDDPKNSAAPDRDRVALGQDHELSYWSDRFGVSEERLRQAVVAVGNSADAVGTWLTSHA